MPLFLFTAHFTALASAGPPIDVGLAVGGAATLAIPIGIDTLNWGLVPIAGPIVGLRASARMPCDDHLHGLRAAKRQRSPSWTASPPPPTGCTSAGGGDHER